MAVHNPQDIRNVLFTGQAGAGKTTLSERLLFESGVISRMGSVEDGMTISDWTEEEKQTKHSLRASVMHFKHEEHMVNFIDAPGLSDFAGHAIACFPAVETVAVVIDAARGIEPMTRRMMTIAKDRNLPRMIIVNKIDEPQADLPGLVDQLREVFGNACLPINLPADNATRVVNVFEHDGSDSEGDAADFSSVREAHQQIVEQIVEVQDDLMTTYLEAGENGFEGGITGQQVHDAFEQALRESHLIPICFVSAKTGAGSKDLMHIMASLLPNPLEGNPRPFVERSEEGGDENNYQAVPDASKPLLAHVFKVATDKHVGKLGIFRVHQGTIKSKSEILVNDQKKAVRVGHMVKRQGKDSVEVDALGPGDIGAITKIDEVQFDAVLHESHELDSVRLRPLPMPRPMYGLAVELKNHADDAKFSTAVHKLMTEDPSLVVEQIAATKQTVMRGLGELHLRITTEKLKSDYGVELLTSPPKVAYKETIAAKAEGHHRHKKQTGGAGQFGEVYLRVEPLAPDNSNTTHGFEFVNATVGGSIPRQFMPAIEKGIRRALSEGAVAGYPMTGIKVEVYDGKYHAVDSKEIAFITAGRKAFIDAVQKAHPALLEPFVTLEITLPAHAMGDISSLVANKRGRVSDTVFMPGDMCLIRAQAPAGELQNFTTELKSLTGGSGSYTMEYSHDEQTPPHVQQEVIAAFAGHKEDD
jgi:elongation factor G